jgi:hypothetical protein
VNAIVLDQQLRILAAMAGDAAMREGQRFSTADRHRPGPMVSTVTDVEPAKVT